MYTYFKTLIDDGFALVYIDDILLLSHTSTHMITIIEQLHQICLKHNLKLAPEKSFYVLLKVKFLGHEIGNQTITPIHSNVEWIHKFKTPTTKRELIRLVGSINFYNKFINNLHINLKPLYTLLHDDVPFKWTPQNEEIFQKSNSPLKICWISNT